MQKMFFCIATLYRKIGRKITFDCGGSDMVAKELFWENLFCSDILLPQQAF
jgi:hypothetical protein